jgi:cysteinyl-tRNA synthetase
MSTRFACYLAAIWLLVLVISAPAHAQTPARDRLDHVDHWFYFLSTDLDADMLSAICDSAYDLVVIDPIVTEVGSTDYDIAAAVRAIQASGNGSGQPRLVLAYLDIGQAESYRTYWQSGWEIGNPEWIISEDPDGWADNYPVAYWDFDWQALWLDDGGILSTVLDAGFDGVYLDWVEAYSDLAVMQQAVNTRRVPHDEMIQFVQAISQFLKSQDPALIVIAQNAAELVEYPAYRDAIDGIAQEHVWFDGAAVTDDPASDTPQGDCPLPATDADIDSAAYYAALSPPCQTISMTPTPAAPCTPAAPNTSAIWSRRAPPGWSC